MWQIDKEFGFDYGHRVWSQKLNKEFATEKQKPICRHIHGHRGTVRVFLEAHTLNDGMVTDFHHLNWLKNFLDTYIDHKFILDINDPLFSNIASGKLMHDGQFVTNSGITIPVLTAYVPETLYQCGFILETDNVELLTTVEKELYEGLFFVDFLPTSENLAAWLFLCVNAKMSKINAQVCKVEWFETPKSRSSYSL